MEPVESGARHKVSKPPRPNYQEPPNSRDDPDPSTDSYFGGRSTPYAEPNGIVGLSLAPGYDHGNDSTTEYPRARTIVTLGFVGIVIPMVSFIAWYMGGQAKQAIAAGAPYRWDGNLRAGYLLGKIFGILWGAVMIVALSVGLFVALVVVLFFSVYGP